MRENPQRIAWIILWSAFVTFFVLLFSVPYLGYTTLNNSEKKLTVSAALTSGTVLVTRTVNSPPEALINVLNSIPEGTRFETSPASQAAIAFGVPDNGQSDTLAVLQLYGGAEALLRLMRTPRFGFSGRSHRLAFELLRGRARIDVADVAGREAEITIITPHALISLDRNGSYSLEVSSLETEVIVHEGIATVLAENGSLILGREERTYIVAGSQPAGVQSGARNLLVNGDFHSVLTDGWAVFQNRSSSEAEQGTIDVLEHQGRQALHFARFDNNWAELGVRQEINRDVRDYAGLHLQLEVWLAEQSLFNCGALGSECPVMVRLEYTDNAGNAREWLQGFYYNAAPASLTPPVPNRCVTCPQPSSIHQFVQPGVWHFYDSPELIETLSQTGFAPVQLDAITIYASGHNFESYVAEVVLFAEE